MAVSSYTERRAKMIVLGLVFLIFFFSFLLIKSADLVVVALRRIAQKTQTQAFALSAIILAIGTSFPELSVGITSALEGNPSISLGDVTGSNIANISLVAGIAAFIAGRVMVRGDFLNRDAFYALLAGLLPYLLLYDGRLSRVDGLILLIIYLAYATSFFRRRYKEIAEEHKKESFSHRFLRQFNHLNGNYRKEIGKLFVGIALLLFSADMIVKIGTHLAALAHLPTFLIGLIFVALGTSLPELAFSFKSLLGHEPSMFFGNLLGSTIANSTLIIGLTSLICPIEVKAVSELLIAAITFVIVFSSFWFFIRTKHRLDRWEAAILFGLYLIFVVVEFL